MKGGKYTYQNIFYSFLQNVQGSKHGGTMFSGGLSLNVPAFIRM